MNDNDASFWATKSFSRPPHRGEAKHPEIKTFAVYRLVCNDTGLSYYGILKDFTYTETTNFVNDKRVRDLTVNNPRQYIKLCPPLYEDIVLYGAACFDAILDTANSCEEVALYNWELSLKHRDFLYNELEYETFTGIKCVETEEVFATPGQAAKAAGLKSKTSILKAINEPDKTAAKLHWISLDKP